MAAGLADRSYIKYSTDVEKKPAGEDEDIKEIAEMINTIQKAQYNMHRHCFSGRSSDHQQAAY